MLRRPLSAGIDSALVFGLRLPRAMTRSMTRTFALVVTNQISFEHHIYVFAVVLKFHILACRIPSITVLE